MKNSEFTSSNLETVGDAIQYCAQVLSKAPVYFGHGTDNAWDEAVALVLDVTELPADSDESVVLRSLTATQAASIDEMLLKRTQENIPLPYLTGKARFAGLDFLCDERAIIPRSPIAELIRNHFRPWYNGPSPTAILDLCCGGGCIGLAAAHYLPDAQVDIVDLDRRALALAKENIEKMALLDRVHAHQSDLFGGLEGRRYDLILSNPPYVDERDLRAMPAEYHHEPELALGSGPDGLTLSRKILARAQNHLNPHGMLVLEVGNSWEALERVFPQIPFTWVDFEFGGHGVLVMSAKELQEYSASFRE